MVKLTDGQESILNTLDEKPLDTADIVGWLNMSYSEYWSDDRVRSSLRRMEDRSLVRRISASPAKWELTGIGRAALEAAQAQRSPAAPASGTPSLP